MKIKLTPEISYVIGFWRKRRIFEGVGIRGDAEHLAIFTKEVLEKGLAETDKIQSSEDRVFFYHSAYRKFFQEIENDQLERFKYLNEYAASYLAGMFDSVGGKTKDGEGLFLANGTREDEMLLLRLNFRAKKMGKQVFIYSKDEFWEFVGNYLQFYDKEGI